MAPKIGDVALDEFIAIAALRESRRRFRSVLIRHLISADHIETCFREGESDRSADPSSRTRNQGNLAVGQHHLPAGAAARSECDPDTPSGYNRAVLNFL